MLVAAVQLTSKANKKKNLAVVTALMTRAVRKGAELIALPECFSFMGPKNEMIKQAEKPGQGEAYIAMRDFAREHEVYVLAGTIAVKVPGEKRPFNRSILFAPDGSEVVHYDKIHLFDSDLGDSTSYRESAIFQAGSRLSVAETSFGKMGLSVCYDLRFPELYRSLVFKGARVFFVPAAFTAYTGKDHWLPLLKARAIENQAFVIAPAQIGKHSEKQVTFGKSCIIDPWGKILAQAADRETVIVADIDFKFLDRVRKQLPALKAYRKNLFS